MEVPALSVAGQSADDQRFSGGLDDFPADNAQSVDLQHAVIWVKSRWTSRKFPAGDAVDGGDGLGVGEVVCGQRQAECGPLALQDEGELAG